MTPTTATLIRTRSAGHNAVLASKLGTADTLVTRTKGLLGRSSLPAGEGLWIKRCNSIHTFFMRFAIDAVFVDSDLKVVSMYQDLKPWRITWLHFSASSVFELPAGTLTGTIDGGSAIDLKVGDQLSIQLPVSSTTASSKVGGRDGQ